MPNTSYLVCAPSKTLYPSACEPKFDPKTWTVAAAARRVPLLWIAMFRPADLVTQEIKTRNDEILSARSVVAPTAAAAAQLRESIPFLDEIFESSEILGPSAELLIQAVSTVDMPFVTIELQEIDALFPESSFQSMLELALGGPFQSQCISGVCQYACE